MSVFRISVLLPLMLLGWVAPAQSQVSLAPTTLFVHDRTGMAEVYVSNQSSNPQEVNVRFEFHYPTSDSTGGIRMIPGSPQVEREHGLSDRIRAFPRRLVIPPNSSQVIRVQVNPMPDRADGMYFTRLILASNAVTPEVASGTQEGAIGTRINYVLEQSIPVFYRKGRNDTGFDLHDISQDRTESRLRLVARLSRTGNSPYMGTMRADMYNATGEKVADTWSPAFLYFDEWRRFDLPIAGLPPGTYRVELRFETQRNDMASGDVVQAPPFIHRMDITL